MVSFDFAIKFSVVTWYDNPKYHGVITLVAGLVSTAANFFPSDQETVAVGLSSFRHGHALFYILPALFRLPWFRNAWLCFTSSGGRYVALWDLLVDVEELSLDEGI